MTKLLVSHRGRNASLRKAILGDAECFGRYCVDSTGTAPSPHGPPVSLYHFNPRDAASDRRELPQPTATRHVTISRQLLACHRFHLPTAGSLPPGRTISMRRSALTDHLRGWLSPGTLVLDREQARLANDPTAPPLGNSHSSRPATLTILWRRLGREPRADHRLHRSTPAESQYDTIVGQLAGRTKNEPRLTA